MLATPINVLETVNGGGTCVFKYASGQILNFRLPTSGRKELMSKLMVIGTKIEKVFLKTQKDLFYLIFRT